MNIKDILKTACLFLNKQDLISLIDLEDQSTVITENKQQINFLINCLDLVYQEISTDYIPLINKEYISIINNKFLINNFEKKFLEIVSLKDENDRRLKYKLFSDYIEINSKKAKIIYKYTPSKITAINSSMENFGNRVSEKTFAFGVAMEYSYINGLYEDAEMWEKRFKDALSIRSGKKLNIKLPVRRWS